MSWDTAGTISSLDLAPPPLMGGIQVAQGYMVMERVPALESDLRPHPDDDWITSSQAQPFLCWMPQQSLGTAKASWLSKCFGILPFANV